MLRLIPFVLLLGGCARNAQPASGSGTDAAAADASVAQPQTRRSDAEAKARGTLDLSKAEAPGESADASAIDPSWRALHLMLLARHAEDLPSQQDLQQIPGANEGLRHIAERAPRMGTRARALSSLGYVAEAADVSYLVDRLGDSSDPMLTAAAATGLSRAGIEAAGSDAITALGELMRHGDPRVAIAAIDALSSAPVGRVLIDAADFSDPAYCPAVRERAAAHAQP